MDSVNIVVIPAEGSAPMASIWYINKLKEYYRKKYHKKAEVFVFEHDCTSGNCLDISTSTILQVRSFVREHGFGEEYEFDPKQEDGIRLRNKIRRFEIYAHGGLGSYVAYEFLRYCPQKLERVFLIGGAPSDAMSREAKKFYGFGAQWRCRLVKNMPALMRRYLGKVVLFSAQCSNPTNDDAIEKIRTLSSEYMQRYPDLYCKQLSFLSSWRIPMNWQVPDGCKVYFVPNGKKQGARWQDRIYDDAVAGAVWEQYGVVPLERPEDGFNSYSFLPTWALFEVINKS